jgi:hypothetical protein
VKLHQLAFVWVPGYFINQSDETAQKTATNAPIYKRRQISRWTLAIWNWKSKKESLATKQNQWEQSTSQMLNVLNALRNDGKLSKNSTKKLKLWLPEW